MIPSSIQRLVSTTLDDVFILGLLDEDESPAEVSPHWRLLYLEVGTKLLELRCVDDTGTLAIQAVDTFSKVPWNSDDLRTTVMSIREVVLNDCEAKNTIANFRMIGSSFTPNGVTCAALELQLENGQEVFIDPSYHFGFRMGGPDQRATWRQNWPGADSLAVWDYRSRAQ